MSERARALYTWLAVKDVAEQAGGVSVWAVRSWIASGELKALNTGTSKRPHYRIKPEWLDDFMNRRTHNA